MGERSAYPRAASCVAGASPVPCGLPSRRLGAPSEEASAARPSASTSAGPSPRLSAAACRVCSRAVRGCTATSLRSLGSTSAAPPRSLRSACGDSRVSRTFTSTILALFLILARSGSFAAGSTCPLVPTINTTLDFTLWRRDLASTDFTSASPKNMPSGLRIPSLHSGQIGTRPAGGPWAASSSVSGFGMHWRGGELLLLLPLAMLLSLPALSPSLPLLWPLPPLRLLALSCNCESCSRTFFCKSVSSGSSGHLNPQPFLVGDQRSSAGCLELSWLPKIRHMSVRRPQAPFRHTAWTSLPWSSTTCALPAAWWNPSTFCVTTMSTHPWASSSAMARWPAFGPWQARRRSLNSRSNSHTFAGSPTKPAMLETSMAS
mmetsp:Transcript_104692/g.337546  ORF Transcript_104692/g.337546 Transcript_104692/m.337546 type:complete len:375 (+) Transcript_104692:114-1238(+)